MKIIQTVAACSKEQCCGCGACEAICPRQCIEMQYNELGAIVPHINSEQCIKCGVCANMCPAMDLKKEEWLNSPIRAYHARGLNDVVYCKSSSGGIATALGETVCQNDGVVYAAVMNVDCGKVFHKRLTNYDELYSMQGSKYVQSRILPEIYRSYCADVDSHKQVLVIGTPCQIAAFRSLRDTHENNNVYFVDLVCHGVPGDFLFTEYLNMEYPDVSAFEEITFRKKKEYVLKVKYPEEHDEYRLTPRYSIYFHGFLMADIYRESCYHCQYARAQRPADITLGDTDFQPDGKVYNSVILYSDGGRKLWDQLDNIECYDVPLEKMIVSHAQLNAPSVKSKAGVRFQKLCKSRGVKYALSHYNYKKNTLIVCRRFLARHKGIHRSVARLPIVGRKL